MKKVLTFLAFIFLFSSVTFTQGIYLRAGGGYGFPIGTTSIGEKYLRTEIHTTTTTNTYSTTDVIASYGAGADFNFALGYKFNENFIFDLGFQYLLGKKYETYNKYIYTNGGTTTVDNNIATSFTRAFLINPSIIFSAGFGKRAPYARFGIIAGSPTLTREQSSFDNGDGITSNNQIWKYKKGIALGYQAAVGINWKLCEKMDLFTEVDFVSLTYYAKEGNLINSTHNGTDNLSQLSVRQKQIIYEKQFDPNTSYDATKPMVSLKEATPLSSLSLQVGIRFALWKKAE
jgi:hypothetical protein